MATIHSKLEPENDLVIHRVEGEFNAEDIKATINRYYAGALGAVMSNILWDFRKASFDQISQRDISEIADLTSNYEHHRQTGRTALVFSSDLGFGLGRMYDITKDIRQSGIDHCGFRDFDQALAWITGQ